LNERGRGVRNLICLGMLEQLAVKSRPEGRLHKWQMSVHTDF
jgi:hypothetical protein